MHVHRALHLHVRSGQDWHQAPGVIPLENAMNAHLRDSDREALWLAHELREELRQALEQKGVGMTPGVSPFVDSSGRPSVIVRMDADAARTLALILGEHRAAQLGQRRHDGSHGMPSQEAAIYPFR
jgi:hypothetical protein